VNIIAAVTGMLYDLVSIHLFCCRNNRPTASSAEFDLVLPSFSVQYHLVSFRSSSTCLHLPPCLPVLGIFNGVFYFKRNIKLFIA
jgi:hypothetical protein